MSYKSGDIQYGLGLAKAITVLQNARLAVVNDSKIGSDLNSNPAWQVLYRAQRYIEDSGTPFQSGQSSAIEILRRLDGKMALRLQYPGLAKLPTRTPSVSERANEFEGISE